MGSLLIRDARIVTQDATRRILRGDLLVEEGRITRIGGTIDASADATIDAAGDLVLPGLVNLHTHSAMTLLRGLGDDLMLEDWLKTRIWPAEATLTRGDVEAGTGLALLEMARTGTTAFNDMYFFADATAHLAAEAGMRAHVAATFVDFDTPELTRAEQLPFAESFVDRWKGHATVTPTLGPHATYTCGDDTLASIRRLHESTGALVHTHCSETRTEVQDVLTRRGARPIDVLHKAGLLGDSVLAHCGWVTKDEIRTMATARAHAAHCPVSNLKLATGGTMPWEEMHEAGVNVGLGTDGAASNNSLDLFETAKFAALVQKQHRWDPRAAPAQRVLDAATLGGARALGLAHEGLVAGAPADLIMVSTAAPHMMPLHDPVSALVYAARGSDVRMTMVNGRMIYQDGQFPTLNVEDIKRRANASGARLADVVRERRDTTRAL